MKGDVVREAEAVVMIAELLRQPSPTLRYASVRITDELSRRQRVDLRLLDRYKEAAA